MDKEKETLEIGNVYTGVNNNFHFQIFGETSETLTELLELLQSKYKVVLK